MGICRLGTWTSDFSISEILHMALSLLSMHALVTKLLRNAICMCVIFSISFNRFESAALI